MPRIPKWAEKKFAERCSWGDAIASIPDDDVNGWDFFVEFPDKIQDVPLEKTLPRRQAFVQIKSTIGPSQRGLVKLSNMLKACSSPDPWFIFLLRKDGAVFGREIIDDLIFDSLKEIRKARLEGLPLHKKSMSINFLPSHLIEGDIVSWMEAKLGTSSQSYAKAKLLQYETKGYESGHGTGKFVVSAKTGKDFTDNFLGLGGGLVVEKFSYTDDRFGLPEKLYEALQRGKLQIQPYAVDKCQKKAAGA